MSETACDAEAELERLRAACRCALKALTQSAAYPVDVALAVHVLSEAVGATDGEQMDGL